MSRTPIRALAALTLALALPAVGVAGDKAYLADVSPAVDGGTVRVRMAIAGTARHSVSVRPDGVQVTLEGAFVDPPKRHIPVDHPAVQEIFAYQYDPDTVRVRLLTQGVDPTALKDHVSVRDEGRFLVLTVRGLPHAAAASEPATPEPAPVAQAKAPSAATAPENADRAAAARAEAMAALEKILDPAPQEEAEAPAAAAKGNGGGMPALVVPHAARVPAAPKGGGAPAEAEAPVPDAAPRADVDAAPQADAAPLADVDPAPAADAVDAANAADAAPLPARPLGARPEGGSVRPDLWTSGIKMAAGLCLVLGLLVGGVALLRKVKAVGIGGRTPIRVLASASLGSRQNIVVVEVEGRRLVVGVTPGGMELLADLSATGGPGGDSAGATVTPLKAAPEGAFAKALARAGRSGPSGQAGHPGPVRERETATALGRATTELERRVQRLKALSA